VFPANSVDATDYDPFESYCAISQSGSCSKQFDFEGEYFFTSGMLLTTNVAFGGKIVVLKKTNVTEKVKVTVHGMFFSIIYIYIYI